MAPPDLVTVYRITCLVNGKAYIGITTKTIGRRWREHVTLSKRAVPKTLLALAIRKHGVGAFVPEIVYQAVDVREACAVERGMIAAYGTMSPHGYNLSNGGEGSVGRQLAPDIRARIGAAVKNLWADPEHRARQVAAFVDRVIPESHVEHLRSLAEGQKGKSRTAVSIAKQSATMMGHTVSAETREKIGAKSKGRKWSAEKKARHSARIRAAHASGAYKNVSEKMREIATARWAAIRGQEKS